MNVEQTKSLGNCKAEGLRGAIWILRQTYPWTSEIDIESITAFLSRKLGVWVLRDPVTESTLFSSKMAITIRVLMHWSRRSLVPCQACVSRDRDRSPCLPSRPIVLTVFCIRRVKRNSERRETLIGRLKRNPIVLEDGLDFLEA